jgi:acyl-homoserine lactone acylase PvdQ
MRNGKWLSLKEHNRSYSALLQSWLRTKAKGFEDFKKTMELLSDNSNNTVFADDKGNIAYWHGNFMPVRDPRFNYDLPVDGSISATDWKGLHKLDEIIHVYNPSSGFIQNCNSTPFAASGLSSPNKKDYPAYMSRDAQNGRALNALRLFDNGNKFDLDKIIKAGYDRYLSIFSILIPGLLESFNQLEDSDSIKGKTAAAIQMLQQWDFYSSEKSIPTTVAVEWGNLMMGKIPKLREETKINDPIELYHLLAKKTPPREQIELLRIALTQLETKYASWQIPWGEINRYQRLTGRLMEKFSDDSVSIPVGLASARWGCLPAFESHSLNGTRRNYGLSGNSFIAAVEFGTRVRARAISTGGESFDPESKHFTDQAGFFVSGQLRDVFFYRDDVLSHQEKRYHPGEE